MQINSSLVANFALYFSVLMILVAVKLKIITISVAKLLFCYVKRFFSEDEKFVRFDNQLLSKDDLQKSLDGTSHASASVFTYITTLICFRHYKIVLNEFFFCIRTRRTALS